MRRVRLAIADDHALVLASLLQLLSGCQGIDVVGTATDGSGAIEVATRLKPDVFLLDIAMPDIDGLQAIPLIRAASPSTNVLLISMHDEQEYLQEALARGASGLVSKAASPDELIAAIVSAATGEVMKVQAPLTKREREVLSLIGEGKASREIASLLSISEKTVEHHRQRLMEKLGIHTEIGLIAHASRLTITPS